MFNNYKNVNSACCTVLVVVFLLFQASRCETWGRVFSLASAPTSAVERLASDVIAGHYHNQRPRQLQASVPLPLALAYALVTNDIQPARSSSM